MSTTKALSGYIIEVFEGGPWLTKNLMVTAKYKKRGVWTTKKEAQEAITKALSPCKQ